MDGKAKRNANIELLRIISMLMIVMLHALGKGNNLVSLIDAPDFNKAMAWILEALSISAVNIFILISGYFLINSTFKVSRLMGLIGECLFYSLGAFLVTIAFGLDTGMEMNTYNLLHVIFPVHMDLYWFMTAYIVLYMLQPVLAKGVEALTHKEYRVMLVALLVYECIFKSILPVKLEIDKQGYNLLWFLIVFLVGGYFRLYGFKYLVNSTRGIILYMFASLLILAESGAIGFVINKTGHLEELSLVSMNYNHIFVLLAAVGLFAAFINKKPMKEGIGSVVCKLSPMALGVYLLHENLSLRYAWPKWLGIYESVYLSAPVFLGKLFLAVISMYAIGTVIDFVRIKIFSLVGKVVAKGKEA